MKADTEKHQSREAARDDEVAQTAGPNTPTDIAGTLAVPVLALAALGLFLFDAGYHFARPVLTDLSPALDVVQLAGQVAATLAALVVALRETRGAHRNTQGTEHRQGTGRNEHTPASPGPALGTDGATPAAGKLPFGAAVCAAALCVLAQAVIAPAPSGLGLVPAYLGTALSGLGFGMCFVTWVCLFCNMGEVKASCLALLAALAASRAADTLIRGTLPPDAWMPLGFGLVDVSLIMLVALSATAGKDKASIDGHGGGAGTACPTLETSGEPVAVELVGAALFSALFGLMTQVHNVSQGTTTMPDSVSCAITLLLFIPLAFFIARSGRPLRLGSLFLATLPVMAGVLVVVALLQSSVLGMADALVKTLFNVYFAATLVYLVQHRAKGAALACGMLLGIWAGTLAGSVAGFAVASFTRLDATAITSVALAAVWLCTLASSFAARPVAQKSETVEKARQTEAPFQPEVRYVDRREEQLERLAQAYGFSARETEVVSLFSQGRSAARIAEELILSENTVKTHLQNAYSKTGVHSKQELIDLLGRQ